MWQRGRLVFEIMPDAFFVMCWSEQLVARKAQLEHAVEEALTLIVSAVNTKRDHIPPVVSADIVTFPYEISIAGWGGSALACVCKQPGTLF
eukprot:scaffold506966_cov43-Prasinocladus_malaysianus.AAC.1